MTQASLCNRYWLAGCLFLHLLLAPTGLREATAPSSLPPLDASRFGNVERRRARFAITSVEAIEEAAQHIFSMMQPLSGAAGPSVGDSPYVGGSPTKTSWMVDMGCRSRSGAGEYVWRHGELVHSGATRRCTAPGGIGPPTVRVGVQPAHHHPHDGGILFVAPLVGCILLAGNRAHALAAVNCWSEIATLPSALAVHRQSLEEGQDFLSRTAVRAAGPDNASFNGASALAEGMLAAQCWYLSLIHI